MTLYVTSVGFRLDESAVISAERNAMMAAFGEHHEWFTHCTIIDEWAEIIYLSWVAGRIEAADAEAARGAAVISALSHSGLGPGSVDVDDVWVTEVSL